MKTKMITVSVRTLLHSFGIGAVIATMMLNMAVAATPTSMDEVIPTSAISYIFSIDR